MKIKFLGMVMATAFFAFSLASCSQPSSDNAANADKDASSENVEKTADVPTGSQTITGEILDMSCYMDHGAKGQSHKKCAEGCILDKKLPAGILGADGQVYLLLEDHDAADAYETALHHAAENVSITGNVVVQNGIQSLIVESVDAGETAES